MNSFRLALSVSAIVAMMATMPLAANAAVGNPYHDGNDLAVDSAAGNNFRLNLRTLEPGCDSASRWMTDRHIDIGDDNRSLHVTVAPGENFSIDQVLVPGRHTGYEVVNDFDTGTRNDDPDIDPGQTATNLDAPLYLNHRDELDIDDVSLFSRVIICVSDHEDSGQNEPYAHSDGGADADQEVSKANEVYAKNRPILQPSIATLGQGKLNGVATYYKMGLGYSVEQWYTEDSIADSPAFSLDLTDPMGYALNPVGNPASHVAIPARIAGPRFDAVHDGPGVLRVNDIDVAGEEFGNPHFERANYGQTDVFNVAGDSKSFVEFGTEGDLPLTWSLKASLAAVDTLRSVEFSPADFDAWMNGWQAYYCGKGAKPAMALTPGTNSPDFRGGCAVQVNPQITLPAPTVANPNPAPVAVTVSAPAANRTCQSNRVIKFTWSKKAKSGKLQFRGRTVKAKRSHGRLRASADLRGMTATTGDYMKVVQTTKMKNGKTAKVSRSFKVC